jgi:ElaA protein
MGLDDEGIIQACTRLLSKGISYPSYSSIGRVVNSKKVRKSGEGKRLMQFSIDKIKEIYPEDDIKISAQSYLLKFYEDLGFEPTGEEYLEDDIPHSGMVYKVT